MENKVDTVEWIDISGDRVEFSVTNAWESFRWCDTPVEWKDVVWLSQCVPSHSFFDLDIET